MQVLDDAPFLPGDQIPQIDERMGNFQQAVEVAAGFQDDFGQGRIVALDQSLEKEGGLRSPPEIRG